MLAWAVGSYTKRELGTTAAGTKLSTYWLPNGQTAALAGTKNLVAAFDWLETHVGPYAFGTDVADFHARLMRGESAIRHYVTDDKPRAHGMISARTATAGRDRAHQLEQPAEKRNLEERRIDHEAHETLHAGTDQQPVDEGKVIGDQ